MNSISSKFDGTENKEQGENWTLFQFLLNNLLFNFKNG